MRFLMVDDSSTMRRIIINTLNQLGYTEVVEASKGRKGIDKSNVADADMVITDWNMPEMNGIEFIRTLRGLDKMKDTPILMVTTNAAKDDIVEALRVGVNNYIVKPFTPDTFKEKIEAIASPIVWVTATDSAVRRNLPMCLPIRCAPL
jgi:two-component system chemotaxis response regulator CheY